MQNRHKKLVFVFVLFHVGLHATTSGELLENGDFESALSRSNWRCNGCTLERVENPYGGKFCGKVTGRSLEWSSVTQYVTPTPGATYKFSAKFRLLNQDADKLWHEVSIMVKEEYSGKSQYSTLGRSPHVRLDEGWIEIGGDHTFPSERADSVNVYIQIPEASINYLIDDVTMNLIEENDAWKEEANHRINEIRKSDVWFNLKTFRGTDPSQFEVQFELVRHSFPFGCVVRAPLMIDTTGTYKAYQDFFYNNFNFGVFGNKMKWKQMERQEGKIDYETAETALDLLTCHNIPVRGHCISWGVEERVPTWLFGKPPAEILRDISQRIYGVVSRFKDKVVHWDVDNENLHGAWFEQATNRSDVLLQMLQRTHRIDPNVKLFLNDFEIINKGLYQVALKQQAMDLVKDGAPLYGIGIQSHIPFVGPASIQVAKSRLDKVAEAGLPIWITELDVEDNDVDKRADRYEDFWRLYFSHEAVEGLLVWGYWDQAHWRPAAALAEGPDVTPNAAGLRWQQLVFDEWHTNLTLSTSTGFYGRAFHGDYKLTVLYDGRVVKRQNVTVVKGKNVFDIYLTHVRG